MRKIVLPLLSVFLLILALAAFFVSKEKTNNWKTYENAQLLLSFRYPKDATFSATIADESNINISSEGYFLTIKTSSRPDVDVNTAAKNLYLQLNSCKNISKDFDSTPVGDDKLTFPGIIAKQYSYRNCSKTDSNYHFVYLLAFKDRFFTIERSFRFYPGSDTDLGKFDKLTNQILSTFKFR